MNQSNRIYFLDHLRAFVIVLVVILHGAMTYMTYSPDWWYVIDPQNSLFFTALVLLIDVPIMQIMFFVAGYFALPALVKRGPARFIKDKFIRVGAPWLFGALFLAPPVTYMIYYTRSVPMSFLQFWASDFWTVAYEQSVYWFLGVLFFFFLILSLAYQTSQRLQTVQRRAALPPWGLFVAFGASMSLGMFLINQVSPIDAWYTRAYILVFQPVRIPLYVGYFGLGIYAYLRSWFSAEGYQPRLLPWAWLWFLSALLYMSHRLYIMPASPEPGPVIQMVYAILFNALCLSSLMAGAALFQQKVNNGDNRFWKLLSLNSYGIYYIHSFILYPIAYFFVPVSMPLFIKAPLVIVLSIFLSWAFSSLVLTKAPIMRKVFAE